MWSNFRSMIPFTSRYISCRKAQQIASEYLDGTLEPKMLWKFNYHVERCKGCSAFVSTLRATISVLHSLPSLEAPPELKQRILEQSLQGGNDSESGT